MAIEERLIIPAESEMRAAIAARDHAYDGVFVYGVLTTGVFCLPSCAARPARPENIRFFVSFEEAEKAGLRACKRCRPRESAALRIRLIELARELQKEGANSIPLARLAAKVDLSPSVFQKRWKKIFGVTPKAYQDAIRLASFKSSLKDGQPVGDAIVEAGFSSTSRVYGESLRNLGMTPGAYRAGGAGETIGYATRETKLGWLMMAATDRGVCFAQFGESASDLFDRLKSEFPKASLVASSAQESDELDRWTELLDFHLSKNAPRPDLPLDLRGTAFQIQVWRTLLKVSEGDAISYGELAVHLDKPKAVRAAASACASNRVAVLVPCHRVLRGDGHLGGYRWGLDRKRALLDLERRRKAQAR